MKFITPLHAESDDEALENAHKSISCHSLLGRVIAAGSRPRLEAAACLPVREVNRELLLRKLTAKNCVIQLCRAVVVRRSSRVPWKMQKVLRKRTLLLFFLFFFCLEGRCGE